MRSRRMLPALCAALLSVPALAGANTYTVVFNTSASWSQAQTAAALAGGYLATITSPAEQAAVEAAISAAAPAQSRSYWINLRETTECCYVWDNGEASCYTNFYDAEPNNGAPGESRGQVLWNLANPARRGFWNDVPDSGYGAAGDISRGGYIIEFGPPDPAGGPCGPCIRVHPGSSCNTPPGGATVITTTITGVSTEPPVGPLAVRTIERTIIDTEPPPGPGKLSPPRTQAVYTIMVTVPSAGVPASTVAAAYVDSINRVAGFGGFVANFMPGSSTVFRMYRVAAFAYSETNTVPGIQVSSSPPPMGSAGGAPMAAWPAQALLALLLSGLAVRAWRTRARSST